MNVLGVPVISSATEHCKTSLRTCTVRSHVDEKFMNELSQQEVDETFTNRDRLRIEVDKDTLNILKR